MSYENFMLWFEENHPALYEKYHSNITYSTVDGQTAAVNNNRISQKEFDHLNHVASSFYSKKDIELFDTVRFVYENEVRQNENDEASTLSNVTMWLRPLIKEINKSRGVVRITFIKPGFNIYWVDNISDELTRQAKGLSDRFQFPYHP